MNYRTRAEAEAHGLGHVWDEAFSGPSRVLPIIAEALGGDFDEVSKRDVKRKVAKGPNGENATELLFCQKRIEPLYQCHQIESYHYIGNKRSEYGLPITKRRKYTPDYQIFLDFPDIIYVEVKGSYFSNPRCEKLYQAAKIRLDIAAEKHEAVFILAVRDGKSWNVRRVPGLGDSIEVPALVLAGLGIEDIGK